MMLKLACIAILIAGLMAAEMSTYKEVHPSPNKCAKQCYGQFSGKDDGSKVKCESCCAGCGFLSAIGLTEVNDEVGKESAKTSCYSTCEKNKKDLDSCHAGCDIELGFAEEELKNMDFGMGGLDQQLSGLTDLFSNFFSVPDIFSLEPVSQNQLEQAAQQKEVGKAMDNNDVILGSDEEAALNEFENLLKNIGILVPVEQDAEAKKYPELSYKDNHGEDRREHQYGDHDEEERGDMAYLRGIWQDRNTMQILLISSITACLFAILWMLCNSSNDPVVRRVAPASDTSSEKPPSYNVIYGANEKKFPILVVAGIDEQADELPQKMPLGYSTQI